MPNGGPAVGRLYREATVTSLLAVTAVASACRLALVMFDVASLFEHVRHDKRPVAQRDRDALSPVPAEGVAGPDAAWEAIVLVGIHTSQLFDQRDQRWAERARCLQDGRHEPGPDGRALVAIFCHFGRCRGVRGVQRLFCGLGFFICL